MSIIATPVPNKAAITPRHILKMSKIISAVDVSSFLFRDDIRSKSGGKIKDKAAPLEAPASETNKPTLGTKVETTDENMTRAIRTDDLGNRGND